MQISVQKTPNGHISMGNNNNECLHAFAEETPATENNEASSEEVKDPQNDSKEINSTEIEGYAKEEAPPALVEASSEQPRGLGWFHLLFLSINTIEY